jgi:hypothetical protein
MYGHPKRLRRFAHAQNDLIWTAADATELDHAAAPNGGSRVLAVTSDRDATLPLLESVSDLIAESVRLAVVGPEIDPAHMSDQPVR